MDNIRYPYRFKTLNEFEYEFGPAWKSYINSGWNQRMDVFFGEVYPFNVDKNKDNNLPDYGIWTIDWVMLTPIKSNIPSYDPKKIKRTLESTKILKFDDYSNIEYRKGSQKFGGLITKLMEFLRIYKDKEDNNLVFNINDFEKESKIKISEINELLSDENKNNLINFGIEIKDNKIIFSSLTKDKSRFFESLNDSIRSEYEIYGVDEFYKNIGGDYKNPHIDDIKKCLYEIDKNNKVDLSNVLDLGSGSGEVTKILKELGYNNIVGCDPYLYKEYINNTGLYCLRYSFSDIQKGLLDNTEFETIIASYSLHLCNTSILPEILWRLSMISKNLIILSPNNNPIITKGNGWILDGSFKISKCKTRIYYSTNN